MTSDERDFRGAAVISTPAASPRDRDPAVDLDKSWRDDVQAQRLLKLIEKPESWAHGIGLHRGCHKELNGVRPPAGYVHREIDWYDVALAVQEVYGSSRTGERRAAAISMMERARDRDGDPTLLDAFLAAEARAEAERQAAIAWRKERLTACGGGPARPEPPRRTFDEAGIPHELKALPQWTNWRADWDPKKGKWNKRPCDGDGRNRAPQTKPEDRMPFEQAVENHRRNPELGIGFVVTAGDLYCGIDLDHCIGDDGELEAWAEPLVGRFASYTEKTVSGRGLRIWIRGHLPEGARNKKGGFGVGERGAIELYQDVRYFTVTGDRLDGTPPEIVDRTEELAALCGELFPPTSASASGRTRSRAGSGNLDDDALLRKARGAANGAKFRALFDEGDLSDSAGDHSRADCQLVRLLAWWARQDPGRIDRLFRRSALYRPKWDEDRGDSTYGERTIAAVLEEMGPDDFYGGSTRESAAPRRTEDDGPQFSNFDLQDSGGEGEARKVPLRIAELRDRLRDVAYDQPWRVGDVLFCRGDDDVPRYLTTPGQLFAWIDELAAVDWTRGSAFITQERFFEHLRATVGRFDAIETTPHQPLIPGICYLHRPLPPATGRDLDRFVDFFAPLDPADRELIKAMVLTVVWGGPPGRRPAFLITAPEDDPEGGRGVGKSMLLDVVAELAGGSIDVNSNDRIADVKTRAFSRGGREKRFIRIDNVKAPRFSSADLEGLITAVEISGRALYEGEGRRPNTLVVGMTINGASLSKDMAQRVVVIKLRRPAFSPTWEHDVRAFARDHRWGILADAIALLAAEAPAIIPRTRWSVWERDVLSRVATLAACQTLIAERQALVDDDSEAGDLVAAQFRDELRRCTIRETNRPVDPDTARVFIPARTAACWLGLATGERLSINRAGGHLQSLGIPQLQKSRTKEARGWIWSGSDAPPGAPAARIVEPRPSATAGDSD